MFLEPSYIEAADLQLFTDSSGSHGFGAFFAGEWLRGDWTQSQKQRLIQWQEIYAIVVASAAWCQSLTGKTALFKIVTMWQLGNASQQSIHR